MLRAAFAFTLLVMFAAPAWAVDTSLALPENLAVVAQPKPGSIKLVLHKFSWTLPADASQYAGERKYLVLFERKLPTERQFKQFATAPVADLAFTTQVGVSKSYTYRVRTFVWAVRKLDWKYSSYSAAVQPSGSAPPAPTPTPLSAWNQRVGTFADGKAVATDANGNILFGGLTYEPISFSVGGQTKSVSPGSFVTKYSPAGAPLWANAVGSDSPADPDIRVAADPWGDAAVAVEFNGGGHFDGFAGQTSRKQDVMLIKYQGSDGRHLWHRTIGGPGNDGVHALVADDDGNLYVGGYFDAPFAPCAGQGVDFGAGEVCGMGAGKALGFLAKYSPDGVLLWLNTSLGASILDLALDGADNLIASSVTGLPYSECARELNGRSLELTRVALADGAASTVRSLPWPTDNFNICNRGFPVAVAANGDILLSGEFIGGLKLDDRAGTTPTVQTSAYVNRESFVVRYTASGDFVWGKKFGNLTGDPSNCQLAIATGLSVADDGEVLITGYFRGVLEFSSTVKIDQDTSSGFFAVRYSGAGKPMAVTDLGINQSCTSMGADILALPGGYAAVAGSRDSGSNVRAFVSVYVP